MLTDELLLWQKRILPVSNSDGPHHSLEDEWVLLCVLFRSRSCLEDRHVPEVGEWTDPNDDIACDEFFYDRLMSRIDFMISSMLMPDGSPITTVFICASSVVFAPGSHAICSRLILRASFVRPRDRDRVSDPRVTV